MWFANRIIITVTAKTEITEIYIKERKKCGGKRLKPGLFDYIVEKVKNKRTLMNNEVEIGIRTIRSRYQCDRFFILHKKGGHDSPLQDIEPDILKIII